VTLRTLFLENLPVKLVSLAVACFLWFYVTSQEVEQQKLQVPIQVLNVPDSLIYLNEIPDQAEINVRASRKDLLWLRLFDKISMNVDLSQAEEGRYSLSLTPKNLTLPASIQAQNVSIQSPSGLTFHLDRLVLREIPVRLVSKSSLPAGHVMRRPPVVEPPAVSVTGPSQTMSTIDSVPTEAVDLARRKSDFRKDLSLGLDPALFRCRPERVTASFFVEPIVEKRLVNLVPVLIRDAQELAIEFEPPAASVTVRGPKSRIDTLVSGDVDLTVVLGGRGPGRYRLPVEVFVPQGLEVSAVKPDSFRVILKKPNTSKGSSP
jgi:YbbR domain-containing protein